MLRVIQNSRVAVAKNYFSTADYYSEGQELTGRWRGIAARQLGLEGDVKQADWDALCDNRNPQTGGQLTPRNETDRTIGYDFNFHVPKSFSILYAMTRDERLLDAFRDSVDATMREIESEMATRVRKGGKNENRTTGNMVWGEYIHFTSRPVQGVPDPHLHAHCFAFNTTWDSQEATWKAGQFRNLKWDSPYFEAVFHSRLTERLVGMGLPVERTAKGWELGELPKTAIDKFSRRTKLIEDKAREKGITDVETKAALGAKTRELKAKDLSFPELQDTWRHWMSPQELDALASLERKIGEDAPPPDETASARALDYAIDHAFERKSVVPERHVLASALRHSVGKATVEQIHGQAARSDLLTGERGGRRMVTTREVLKEERQMIGFAREGRGSCKPFAKDRHQFNRDWLNDAQRKAVEHILRSRDRVILLRGAAGVGKTTLLQEAVEGIETSGKKVFAFAPSAAASRGELRAAGFKGADTVARLLVDEKLQKQIAGEVVLIDEAGLLGSKTMADVFKLADQLDARVLLSGDRYQHGSVQRGAALRLLEEEAGLVPAEVKEIQRQKGAYKEAVKALGDGQVLEGFSRLDELGWVRQIPQDERYQQLAADYMNAIAKGETALVVSPTHAEGDRITEEIRQRLREADSLGKDQRIFLKLESGNLTAAERGDAINYVPGDVLQFEQNAKGFKRGERITVDKLATLPLNQAERFQLYHPSTLSLATGDLVRITHSGQTADGKHRLENGAMYHVRGFDDRDNLVLDNGWVVDKDFGHLSHGYVVTSHASQGKTVDRVFIGQASESFPASSREQFYVSVSRAKKGAVVYTDDKAALRDAINQSDERVTATELVGGTAADRQTVPLRQQREALPEQVQQQEREGMNYER